MRILLCSFLSLIVISCQEASMFYETRSFPGESWHADSAATFRVRVDDTLSNHRLFLHLRNGGGYPYSNIHIFMHTVYPDNTVSADTFEVMLAEPSGKWLGNGSGDVHEHKVLFDDRVIFPDTGLYIFSMRQGMRTNELSHVLDVGLEIQKQ